MIALQSNKLNRLFKSRPKVTVRPLRTVLPILIALICLAWVLFVTPAIAVPDWSYEGASDPGHWSDLQPEYSLCETGQSQSPINLRSQEDRNDNEVLSMDYHPSPLDEVNNGRTLKVIYAAGNTLTLNDQTYELVQFHFHAPSEHLIENKSSAMELHLVHKNAANQLAVLGVMIEPGAPNPYLEDIWQHMPAVEEENASPLDIDVSSLLPRDLSFYHYQGSLTTPPCSESVHWAVLKQPIQASRQQITTYQSRFHANARPIQGLHDRTIQFSHSLS